MEFCILKSLKILDFSGNKAKEILNLRIFAFRDNVFLDVSFVKKIERKKHRIKAIMWYLFRNKAHGKQVYLWIFSMFTDCWQTQTDIFNHSVYSGIKKVLKIKIIFREHDVTQEDYLNLSNSWRVRIKFFIVRF